MGGHDKRIVTVGVGLLPLTRDDRLVLGTRDWSSSHFCGVTVARFIGPAPRHPFDDTRHEAILSNESSESALIEAKVVRRWPGLQLPGSPLFFVIPADV